MAGCAIWSTARFGLVRAALAEREVLLRMAPHLIRPLRFVLPLDTARRSPAVLTARPFPLRPARPPRNPAAARAASISPSTRPASRCRRHFHRGYEYSDCFADDARLVVLNAVDAAERGAIIRTRTRCVRAERGDTWRLVLNAQGLREVVTARVLVNAAGPWADTVAETVLRQKPCRRLRLDKGSHIVVRRLYDHDRAYILQAADGRVVFTIPFRARLHADRDHRSRLFRRSCDRRADGEDISYLCSAVNEYFRTVVSAADAVWAFAGVRALYGDDARKPQDVGRDYALFLDRGFLKAPLLTVYGGKLTTYRRLAEDVLARLARFLGRSQPWTARTPLPGGDFPYDGWRHWSSARGSDGRSSPTTICGGLCAHTARGSTAS